jgi:hypothetical protein
MADAKRGIPARMIEQGAYSMLQRIWRWVLRAFGRADLQQKDAQGDPPKDIYPLW